MTLDAQNVQKMLDEVIPQFQSALADRDATISDLRAQLASIPAEDPEDAPVMARLDAYLNPTTAPADTTPQIEVVQ